MSEAQLVRKFYEAFQRLDANTMAECYHDEVEFEDPAFGQLQGERAKAMWKMLCGNAKDLEVQFEILKAGFGKAKVKWEAHYTFSQTDRKVHNIVEADLTIENGKIIKHIDHFNLRKWSIQAMGLTGKVLGGTAFFKRKLQQQTNRLLDKFISRN
ncbi:MAG: nuclear transport factor 2 family protein [Bacteroidetes bacterium]|nr:MAG: nuclear transport factor 2 family protein [Bacteroidota bacterium]